MEGLRDRTQFLGTLGRRTRARASHGILPQPPRSGPTYQKHRFRTHSFLTHHSAETSPLRRGGGCKGTPDPELVFTVFTLQCVWMHHEYATTRPRAPLVRPPSPLLYSRARSHVIAHGHVIQRTQATLRMPEGAHAAT